MGDWKTENMNARKREWVSDWEKEESTGMLLLREGLREKETEFKWDTATEKRDNWIKREFTVWCISFKVNHSELFLDGWDSI